MFNRDLVAELPFILMHPKPEEEEPSQTATPSRRASKDVGNNVPVDTNLIQLDAWVESFSRFLLVVSLFTYYSDENNVQDYDDDIIFEDFARLRLKGGETDAWSWKLKKIRIVLSPNVICIYTHALER